MLCDVLLIFQLVLEAQEVDIMYAWYMVFICAIVFMGATGLQSPAVCRYDSQEKIMDIDKHASQNYNGSASSSYQHMILSKMLNTALTMSPIDLALTFSWMYGFLNESSSMCHWNVVSLHRLCGTIRFLNTDIHLIHSTFPCMLDLYSLVMPLM